MTVGMCLVELSEDMDASQVKQNVRTAMDATPIGRQLVVTFPMRVEWEPSSPFEAWVTQEVLGSPNHRSDSSGWLFSGNIEVRLCRVKAERRQVMQEIGIILFRRAGEMAYTRRAQMSTSDISQATLPALHPVFTRDVANNVWHMPMAGAAGRIRRRIQPLFTWPDEETLVFRAGRKRISRWNTLDLEKDLIGVPTKQGYEWRN